MPTPDDIKRKRVTASSDEGDDLELELEPPDAAVLAAEERRAREAIQDIEMSIDIDEIYREVGRRRGGEILEDWARKAPSGFRFQVKHLLILTAVLAIALTLARLELFVTTIVLMLMISVAALYGYLQWQEKKQQDEADRRRREMYARRRAYLEKRNNPLQKFDEVATAGQEISESDGTGRDAGERPAFRFQFSMRQLLAAITAAAVILFAVQWLGGPDNAAVLLGFLALGGLVIQAIGFQPPEFLVLGWWIILVLYVLLSIVAVVWNRIA
jgi:hypothetical protein